MNLIVIFFLLNVNIFEGILTFTFVFFFAFTITFANRWLLLTFTFVFFFAFTITFANRWLLVSNNLTPVVIAFASTKKARISPNALLGLFIIVFLISFWPSVIITAAPITINSGFFANSTTVFIPLKFFLVSTPILSLVLLGSGFILFAIIKAPSEIKFLDVLAVHLRTVFPALKTPIISRIIIFVVFTAVFFMKPKVFTKKIKSFNIPFPFLA